MALALLRGIILGFAAGIPVGPVNAAVIDTAMRKCMRRAIAIGMGGAFMDFLYSQMAVFGLRGVMSSHPWLSNAFLGLGGLVLMVFGWKAVSSPRLIERTDVFVKKPVVARALAAAFLGGVLITVANPAALLSWLAISGAALSDLSRTETVIAGLGIFLGCTAWFVGIAYLASLGRIKLGTRAQWITRGIGAALVVYGVFLLGKASFVVLAARQ